MKILKQAIKIVSVIMLAASLVLIMSIQRKNEVSTSHSSPPIPVAAVVSPTLIPAPKVLTSAMDSPEGSKTLSLERVESAGLPLHSISVTTQLDHGIRDILKNNTLYRNLTIPYNTWSPDTIYFFMQETTSEGKDYLVFQSSGDYFANATQALSIQQLFKQQVQGYVIEEVTGWAAPTLLIVNTKAIDSNDKVSFWFDMPSQTFMQLGTYFK